MGRLTLREIRRETLDFLDEADIFDDGWRTPTEVQRALGLGGSDFYRCALVLERLAHEGLVELQYPASKGKRYFRRRQP